MASGTRLARLKVLEDDSKLKPKIRKLDKLNPSSNSQKKVGSKRNKTHQKDLSKSGKLDRIDSSSGGANFKKRSVSIMHKNKMGNGNIESLSVLDKAKKSANTPTKKQRENHKTDSSSFDDSTTSSSPQNKKRKKDELSTNDDSIRSFSPQNKKQKKNGDDIALESDNMKDGVNEEMSIKKHFHVRTYKKLFKRKAKKSESHGDNESCVNENSPLGAFLSDLGANISKEKEGGDIDNRKGDAHDEGESVAETIEPLEKKYFKRREIFALNLDKHTPNEDAKHDTGAKPSGFRGRKRILDEIFVESSGKGKLHQESCEVNKQPSPPFINEPGVSLSEGVGNDVCLEENNNIDLNGCLYSPNICLICKQGGQLISCSGKGCKRSYHLPCLKPPLPGAWLCKFCVKIKLDSGAYSLSDGIESVWDVDEGVQSGKIYFVKYKGLSHLHNRWIPESQLLHDSPSLYAKFKKRNHKEKVTKWRKEWAEPERLLQRRLVELSEASSGLSVESSNYCIEWFVKWKGLEYDQATWELENPLLQTSSKAGRLVEDYERRCEQAKSLYDPLKREKVLRAKKDPFYRLSDLPDGCPEDLGNDLLDCVNRLREFWHKSVNAVLVDDQDRITKSVLFISSLQSYACQPSIIITTPGSIPLWQAKLGRLAPSLNLVMYHGDKDFRKMIRNFEFYDENACLMFHVLLADHEAIIEDLDIVNCMGWDFLIIDKCQNSKISKSLDQLKGINADFKLVLFDGQLKDSVSEYDILLSFLSKVAGNGLDGGSSDANEASGALPTAKEKLAHHIAYERKVDSFNFTEYWVPVPLSNVQVEQYCSTLVSNSNVLRSNSRSDLVGALHSILITTRKCCDHPYLVDGELRGQLTKGLQNGEFLNAEVRASGKLFILDRILHEMKDRGLRVVILYQSLGGPGKISLGDILDDFLQQRFSMDSYERIETGLVATKKMAALKMFNNKESGRFVFLIENRACLPSIKLRSVDAVILFDSDWNPLNDLRSLQKISIESKRDCVKVFRLYTSFTVEEKLLIFAKQDTVIESNIENISRNTTLSLLGWGASYLFRKLDQFHSSSGTTSISEPSFDKLCLNDVVSEVLSELPAKVEKCNTSPRSVITKASQSGASSYAGDIALVGEEEEKSKPDKEMPVFWTELLDRKHRRWIHISDRTQRIRRQVHSFGGVSTRNESESIEAKKRRKPSPVDLVTLPECSQEKRDSFKDGHKSSIDESEGGEPKLEEQRNLLELLKPELSTLCDVLGLPARVKDKAREFLVYIMNNHDVCSKQVTVLQALKISLCWRAASMLKHQLDRSESFLIAKKHLNYECSEEEASSVYLRLVILKEKFPSQEELLDNSNVFNSLDYQSLCSKEALSSQTKQIEALNNTSDLAPGVCKSPEQLILLKDITSTKLRQNLGMIDDQRIKNLFHLIAKISIKRSEDLFHKHQAEALLLEKQMQDDKVQLEKAHVLDLACVRSIQIDMPLTHAKIISLNREFSLKMVNFIHHYKRQREKLLSLQIEMRKKEQELRHSWLLKAKIDQLESSFFNAPLPETGFQVEKYTRNSLSSTEVVNHSGVQQSGTVDDEMMPVVIDAGRHGGREDSNVPILPSVQDLFTTNEDGNPHGASDSGTKRGEDCSNEVTNHHSNSSVDSMCCNDASPSSLANCTPAPAGTAELDRLPIVGCQIATACSTPYCPIGQNEGTTQPIAVGPTIFSIPEGAAGQLQQQRDPLSEKLPSLNVIGSSIMQVAGAVENATSNQQINCDNILPARPPEGRLADNPASEGVPSDPLASTSVQPEQQMGWVPPQALYADPFQNELLRIRKQSDFSAKRHEDKKVQLQLAREEELEKVKRKYDAMSQDAERDHLRDRKMFQAIYEKVFWSKLFAEEIRSKYYDHREGASAPLQGPNLTNASSLSQPQHPSRPLSATAPPSVPQPSTLPSQTANHESNPPSFASLRPRTRFPAPQTGTQPFSSFLSNVARASSTPRPSLQVSRSPAPHLQRFRPVSPAPGPIQQPLPAPSIPSLNPTPRPAPLHSSLPMEASACLLDSIPLNPPADARLNTGIICLSDDE